MIEGASVGSDVLAYESILLIIHSMVPCLVTDFREMCCNVGMALCLTFPFFHLLIRYHQKKKQIMPDASPCVMVYALTNVNAFLKFEDAIGEVK